MAATVVLRRGFGRIKRVGKGNGLDPRHGGILFKLGVKEKNNRQFQRFAGAELLIFETETGDFVEIGARAIGADIEHGPRRSHLIRHIRDLVKHGRGLAGTQLDFWRFGRKCPGEAGTQHWHRTAQSNHVQP